MMRVARRSTPYECGDAPVAHRKLTFAVARCVMCLPVRPPLAGNKLLYGGQQKVMVVGGPNTREDYHIEIGEVSHSNGGTPPCGGTCVCDRLLFDASSIKATPPSATFRRRSSSS